MGQCAAIFREDVHFTHVPTVARYSLNVSETRWDVRAELRHLIYLYVLEIELGGLSQCVCV